MRRHHIRLVLAGLAVAATLTACGAGSGVTAPQPSSSNATPQASSPIARTAHRRQIRHRHRGPRPRPTTTSRSPTHVGQLVVSSASAHAVQAQPASGSCHARGSGRYSEPDPACTPGALNPAVTQATIGQTICVSGWTETVRPSESITEPEKLASMAAYGDGGSAHEYEYDHLVSLELGGAVNDARNLWPEPGASPNPKDAVEDALHRTVCEGQLQLAEAQHIIATGWVSWARGHTAPSPAPAPATSRSRSTSTSTSTNSASPPAAAGPNKPIASVNCSDFATHAAAQQWFTQHGGSRTNDVAGLDGNANGLACESLP